jgi:hypothetical protein
MGGRLMNKELEITWEEAPFEYTRIILEFSLMDWGKHETLYQHSQCLGRRLNQHSQCLGRRMNQHSECLGRRMNWASPECHKPTLSSSVIWCHIVWYIGTRVSEEAAASIFRLYLKNQAAGYSESPTIRRYVSEDRNLKETSYKNVNIIELAQDRARCGVWCLQ